MSFNSRLVKATQSTVVALATVTTGTTTGGPSLNLSGQMQPVAGSVCANVSAAVTTSSLAIVTRWQCSQDGSTWVDLKGHNTPAEVQVAASGTGSLVTTAYVQSLPISPPYPFVRLAVKSSGATGDVGDNITISYNILKDKS